MSKREEFEKWFKSKGGKLDIPAAPLPDLIKAIAWEGYQAARVQGDADPGVDLTEFGKGELVVAGGNYGGKPAVFIAPVQNGPGIVGEKTGNKEPKGAPYLLPGERVMTFPTQEQVRTVCAALWNLPVPQPEAAKVPEWINQPPFSVSESDVYVPPGTTGLVWQDEKGVNVRSWEFARWVLNNAPADSYAKWSESDEH